MHRYQTNLRPRRTLITGEPISTIRVKFPSTHPHYKSTCTKSTNDGYTYGHHEISADDDSDGSISNFQRVFCCLELCVPWPTSRTNRKSFHEKEEESESQTLPPSPTPTDEEEDDENDDIIRTPLMKMIDSPTTSTVVNVNEEEVSKSSSNKDDSVVSNLNAKFDKVHDENNAHPKQNQRLRNRIRKSEDRDFEVQLGIIRSPLITHTTITSNDDDNEEEEETDDEGEGINGKCDVGEEEEVLSFNYTNFSDERSGDNDGYSSSRADSFTATTSHSSEVGLGTTMPYVQLPLNFPPSSDLTTATQEIEGGNHIDLDNDDSCSSSTVSSNLSFDADDFGEDDVFGSSRYTCTLDGPSFDGSLVASTLLGLSPISEEGSDDEDSDDEDSITVAGTSISLG